MKEEHPFPLLSVHYCNVGDTILALNRVSHGIEQPMAGDGLKGQTARNSKQAATSHDQLKPSHENAPWLRRILASTLCNDCSSSDLHRLLRRLHLLQVPTKTSGALVSSIYTSDSHPEAREIVAQSRARILDVYDAIVSHAYFNMRPITRLTYSITDLKI